MKFQKVKIATAHIKGLEELPYYFDDKEGYMWDIYFAKSTTLNFSNLTCIYAGETGEESKKFYDEITANLKQANIKENDRVSVLFDDNREVLAIGAIGEDVWIDLNDNFKKKIFEELNIVITALEVY